MSKTAVCVGFLLSWLASAQVPVEQEPRHHLAFENEFLAVLEPQIPAGDTTLEHLHAHDDATVCIHGSQVRAKQPGGEWSNPGMVCVPGAVGFTEYTGKSRSHTVQNVGSGEYHLTLVENLRPSEWTNFEEITVPGMKVLKENRAFRAYDVQLSGSSVPAHSHQVPTVVIVVSGEASAGDQRLERPGQSIFIPTGKEHQIAAKGDARVVEIEVR
jgi:mannose-6-phosphate isomerase-like protein (cupin superfamily)